MTDNNVNWPALKTCKLLFSQERVLDPNFEEGMTIALVYFSPLLHFHPFHCLLFLRTLQLPLLHCL